jgi:RNA polymerase sigma-70 factor (sigma-E family)
VTFEEFAAANTAALLRYAAVLTGDRHLAQDLVQDALIRTHDRWSRVESADRPDAYVRRIVVNLYLSWRRRAAVRRTTLTADGQPPHGRTVPGPADAHAERDALWGRLAALPPRQRAVLVLRYYEDLADADIAAVLGCSAATVRGHAFRALAALRLEDADLSRQEW